MNAPGKPSRLEAALPFAALAAIVVLSLALVSARMTGASVSAQLSQLREIHGSVPSGSPIPDLDLQLAGGTATRMSSLCAAGPLVLVFSLKDCPSCEAIGPEWQTLAAEHGAWRVMVLETGDPGTQPPSPVLHARAVPAQVMERWGITRVPAVAAVDASCRMVAMGVGEAGSRSILQLVRRK